MLLQVVVALVALAVVQCVPSGSSVYRNISFGSSDYSQYFEKQFSYDQHTPAGQDKRFHMGPPLAVSIFAGDKTFDKGSGTFPRSEISGKEGVILAANTRYVIDWNVNIAKYDSRYMFCFMQAFQGGANSGPNVMLRWEEGAYALWNINGGTSHVRMSGNVQQDLNTWVHWTVDLSIGSSNGHVIVSRNGAVVGKLSGKTGTNDASFLKLGIYTQHVNNVYNMTTLLSDLTVVEYR